MNPSDYRRAIDNLLQSDLSPSQADATALYSAPAYAAPAPAAEGIYEAFRDGFDRYYDQSSSSWEDPAELDRFGRDQLAYWTARALEQSNNVPGCVMGVTPQAFCELGKTGEPGQCCDPTADPFPSKPYFYVLASGRSFVDVGRDFGRDENGWVELRRANADDPEGFIKLPNKWCVWKHWEPGKRLRIPGTWNEAEFTTRVTGRLVDGWGHAITLEQVQGKALFFMRGIPNRWQTPLRMLIELAGPEANQPGFTRSLEHDEVMAKRLVERTFLAK